MKIRLGKTGMGEIILAKGRLATTIHDSAPRPKRSLFANPNENGEIFEKKE